jgi:hypothetical protein
MLWVKNAITTAITSGDKHAWNKENKRSFGLEPLITDALR